MISSSQVLAMLLAIAPHTPRLHAATVAGAIASVSSTREDAAVLLAIEYEETSIMPGANYEFGLTCCAARLEGQPLDSFANVALGIWRLGYRHGHSMTNGFFFYNSGRWPQNVRGHSHAFKAAGQRALAYAHRCEHVVARALRAPGR